MITALETHKKLIFDCLDAWNTADAEKTASFYSDDLDYRDPNTPDGIHGKESFVRYLRVLFRRWPEQKWTPDLLMPHEQAGAFSASYTFSFGNKKMTVHGRGIDRIEFTGGLISLNWVYLNADSWPLLLRGG